MEFPHETYTQTVAIEFTSAEAARQASVSPTPLYDGCEWAISTRWDDNNEPDLKMRDTLLAHGYKGTFYLNDPDYWGDFRPTARKLLEGGCTIGGHSLTHAMLSYCSRNRIFEELAGVRAAWEAAVDFPVLSYTFSFCRYHNPLEGHNAAQADIDRLLARAGYYHVTNHKYEEDIETDTIISPIMPSDGADIDEFAQAALKDEAFRLRHPNLSHSMHVWYETPDAWRKFERQLDDYGQNADWWYPNQNEYAAYRYQFANSRLSPVDVEGRTLRFRIERPRLIDLNDAIPLTFEIGGVQREDVKAVTCETAAATCSDRSGDAMRFHLAHDRSQSLPMRIGLVANTENRHEPADGDRDADFPAIGALLHFDDGRLELLLANDGNEPLEDIRVTFRLPLAWADGVVRRELATLPAGGRVAEAVRPTRATDDYKYNSGSSYFQAQIDFVLAGQAGRLHATCRVRNETADTSYPQGRFARLGPIDADRFDATRLADDVRAGKLDEASWSPDGGEALRWVVDDDPFDAPYLDVETIRTYGAFRCEIAACYLLRSDVHSPSDRQVDLIFNTDVIGQAFLNGEPVVDGSASLRQGDNRLVLVFQTRFGERHFSQFCCDHGGCFLRLAQPGTFRRLTDVRFSPTVE